MVRPLAQDSEVRLPDRIDAIVIGASAGAVDALGAILPLLPSGTPWPVIAVVHLPANRPSLLSSLFGRTCSLAVREPAAKEPIGPGIWFAPADYHLLVEKNLTFALSIDPPVNHSRPSIDVLFESAADAFGAAVLAIVLTGANADGARGAGIIRDAGGFVVVQDPDTAEASAMPRAAVQLASPQWVAPVGRIGNALRAAALRSLS